MTVSFDSIYLLTLLYLLAVTCVVLKIFWT